MAQFVMPKSGAPILVWWPATINEPHDDGVVEAKTMHVRFQIVTDEDLQTLLREGGVAAVLGRVVAGWKLKDRDGADVPFDHFGEIAAIPFVREGLFASYLDCSRGAPRKN